MENRFTSFALEEEPSTYTEGESKSRRSSILKPPKARAPLQEVNLGGSADDTEDFDTLRKRRVSFAGVNSVKEFFSQAESLQVCHIQSYEETFSTSSDNSHNSSAAKSVQLSTPKNAVPSGVDHNFADDPMDLTDSIIDNNHVQNKLAPIPVQVIPVFAQSAQLPESAMSNKANLPSWSGRKSLAVGNSQNTIYDGNMTSSNMSISSVVGASSQKPRNPDPSVPSSSPWSCSMEMTEPVHVPPNRKSNVFPSFRNSSKPPEQSDSGMEITEAVPVKIRPFSINRGNDNFGDTSMEMTEVLKKVDVKSISSRMSYPNKSASMDLTEVVHVPRKSGHFQSSNFENTTGNCGMDFTEPIKVHLMQSNPSERLQPAQRLVSSENPPTPIHHIAPFPHGDNMGFSSSERDCDKSMMQPTDNQSLSDMEMTGVLSLSKYNKLVSNDGDDEDMDFTQLLPVHCNKKARTSNEPEDEPFQIISPLSNKVIDVQQQPIEHNKPLASREPVSPLINEDIGGRNNPVTSEDISAALDPLEDDNDTLALNFKNINRDEEGPIELSFLTEFRESPVSDKPSVPVVAGHNLTMDQSADLYDHEHLLLYSPPKTSKQLNVGSEIKKAPDFERVSLPIEPLRKATELHQSSPPPLKLNTQKKLSVGFEELVVNQQTSNVEPLSDPLRNVRRSCSFMGEGRAPSRVRASFKDFEIKPDSMIANESLSTVGLDDPEILKVGLNDMTCPEQVPSICMSMTANLTSPCSNSRKSLVDRAAFLSFVTRDKLDDENKCDPAKSIQPIFGEIVGSVEDRKDRLIKRSENHDDQDTSVSVPFVFKSLPDKIQSKTHKFDQSIPIIEFEASPQQPSHQPTVTSDGGLPNWRTSLGITRKSIDPTQLVSNQDAKEQDESLSIPFVCKAVPDGTRLVSNKLGLSFPIIECDEAPSFAQMELTEVSSPVNIESRKSLGRMSGAPVWSSVQPSCSSGQMELTDVVAIGRKSVRPSSCFPNSNEHSCIVMDESLMKIESPVKDNLSVVRLDQRESSEEPLTTGCDMEETNVKPKDIENHCKSLLGQSLSLTSQETITRPSASNVDFVLDNGRKSCTNIDIEDTLIKSTTKPFEVSTEHTRLPDNVDMEQTALNPSTRLSIVAENRKSFFDLPPPPKEHDTVEECKSLPNQVREENQGFFNCDNASSRSEFATEKIRTSFPPTRLSSRSSAPGEVLGTQIEDEYSINEENNVKTSPKTVAIEVTNDNIENVHSNDVHASANETAGIDQFLNVGLDNHDELKTTSVTPNVLTGNETYESFPPARPSCRKSGFSMFREARPQDVCSNDQVKHVQNSPEQATNGIIPSNAINEDNVVEKSEIIEAVSIPMLDSKTDLEHEDQKLNKTGMRLSRKSVRFFNTDAKEEPCSDLIEKPERMTGIDVEQDDRCAPELMSSNGSSEAQLNSCVKEDDENAPVPTRRPSRKSCIGVALEEGEGSQKPNSGVSDEFEFAIRRGKRKSAIGTRQSDNYPEINPQDPEAYNKLDVTPLDGQQYESKMSVIPDCSSAELKPEDKEVDLSQDMMNISLNGGEVSESEMENLHVTSTPCKIRTSCARVDESSWDRKRDRSGFAKTQPTTTDLTNDLSQEMMNISIQSDTRSPLPKKLSLHRKSTTIDSSTIDKRHLNAEQSNRELPSKEDGNYRSDEPVKYQTTGNIFENTNSLKGDLPYNIRVENRDLMKRHGFYLLGSQTNWETLLYDRVIGIRVVLPLCKFTENTKIESIQYTYYSWRIGRTLLLDRETVEFIQSRIHRNMPQEWLPEECNKIGDLDRIVSLLRNDIEMLNPLIKQLEYVKRRHPCTISKDSISFKVVNLNVMAHFEVMLELGNSHKMSDCIVTVKNYSGKINLDTVRLVFQALPSSDVNVLLRFVRYLASETSQCLTAD